MNYALLARKSADYAVRSETHLERLRRIAESADGLRGTDISDLSHEERIRLARAQ